MQVGYDIHRIIHQMNTMIGAIEVCREEIRNNCFDEKHPFLHLGYAVAVGNFNADENQGNLGCMRSRDEECY